MGTQKKKKEEDIEDIMYKMEEMEGAIKKKQTWIEMYKNKINELKEDIKMLENHKKKLGRALLKTLDEEEKSEEEEGELVEIWKNNGEEQ
jgi:peptidoglycan hydrolase CwlO-like protein